MSRGTHIPGLLKLAGRILCRPISISLILILILAIISILFLGISLTTIIITLMILAVLLFLFIFSRAKWDCSIKKNQNKQGYWIDFGKSLTTEGFKRFHFDTKGIPRFSVKSKKVYFPTFVGWWAMQLYNIFTTASKDKQQTLKTKFLVQADWFIHNAKIKNINGKKCAVWLYDFDWKEGTAILKKPWISALGQGMAASTLARAYTLTKKKKYRDLAKLATVAFTIDIENSGLKVKKGKHIFYEEYPAKPYAHVLDGFVFSLFGLYDVYAVTNDKAILTLFKQGAKALTHSKNQWDFAGVWSYYGSHNILCDHYYNKLNSAQLYALAEITKNKNMNKQAKKWDPKNLTFMKRLLIFSIGKFLTLRYSIRMAVKGGNF